MLESTFAEIKTRPRTAWFRLFKESTLLVGERFGDKEPRYTLRDMERMRLLGVAQGLALNAAILNEAHKIQEDVEDWGVFARASGLEA